jgi:hypothetical protein
MWQLYVSAPATRNVIWEIDYAFVKADGTENGAIKVSYVASTIDVNARTQNLSYEDQLPTMTGLVGAKYLNLTLRRKSTGFGADTYPNDADIFATKLVIVP